MRGRDELQKRPRHRREPGKEQAKTGMAMVRPDDRTQRLETIRAPNLHVVGLVEELVRKVPVLFERLVGAAGANMGETNM